MTSGDRNDSLDRALRRLSPQQAAATPSCLDAETAAAWVEGGLSAAEAMRLEAHASTCLRCQSLLAALGHAEQAVPALPKAQPWWRAWSGWLVPLTAAATVLIAVAVWLRIPTPRGTPAAESTRTETAAPENAPTQPAQTADADPRALRAAPPPARAAESRADGAVARPDAPAAAGSATVASPPARPLAKAEEPGAIPRDQAAPLERFQAAAVPQAREVAGQTAAMMRADAGAPVEFASPEGAARWRIANGVVQLSTDAGVSWATVRVGGSAPIVAGSAPSASVCWLVGQGGLVLRTTDRVTWTTVSFPEMVDLVSVRASDALVVTVATADGRTFTTRDGETWTRSP